MTSLKTIGAIPELLYEILSHLAPQDTFSLLLTSKTFYPVCYKHLWTDLRLYRVHASEADERRARLISDGILKAIQGRRWGCSGLRFTRVLRLHRGSLGGGVGGFVRSGLCNEVMRLLDAGGMELEGFEVSYFTAFLKRIKEYSLKKGPSKFFLTVTAGHNINAVLQMNSGLPLQNITTLNLEMDWTVTAPTIPFSEPAVTETFGSGIEGGYGAYDDDDNDQGSWSDANGGPISNDPSQLDGQLAYSLVDLLNRTTNLKVLSIYTVKDYYRRRYRPLLIQKYLILVRDAIKTHQTLHTLEIRGKFFHPSFFITPPESARKVVYEGIFSHDWFRRFSKCEFGGVLDLRVRCRHNRQQTRKFEREFAPNKVVIEDVRVCGLRRCELLGVGRVTEGLEEAVLRRNKRLVDDSRRRLEGVIAGRV
ncbi:hypothetical protein TWF506_001189 [Arthrobotrys conoides]|uniref:F-box domain-containing protein n=1 Tax=Arthrobotrys conoides TaxID=74498 RepID=A0AAN8S1L4_9PEZI